MSEEELQELIDKHGPVEDWVFVTCPCVTLGATYSNTGPNLDGSPDTCSLCDDVGEAPEFLISEPVVVSDAEEA